MPLLLVLAFIVVPLVELWVIGDGHRGAEPVRGRDPGAMQVDGDLIDHELFPRPSWQQRCELIGVCRPVGVVIT